MPSARESVVDLLREKNAPLSARSISRELGLKKRVVVAVCHQDPLLMKVHPSHCGWGKEEASLFVFSEDKKWLGTKEFLG